MMEPQLTNLHGEEDLAEMRRYIVGSQPWRKSPEYRDWREDVIERDEVCQCCGNPEELHAHHIHKAEHFPELRFDVANGITLCKDCHHYVHNDICGGFIYPCTPEDLYRFIDTLGKNLSVIRRKTYKLRKQVGAK